MEKIILSVVIGVVVLTVVAVVVIGLNLDSAVKKGVETYGPEFTKVSVKLEGVSLSILSGGGSIKGLVVGNPEGFATPHAIKVDKASLSVSPGSVFSDKIVIKSIRVEEPEINFETGLTGGDNLHKILDNVTAATGGPSTNAASGPSKKLQVDEFVLTGARVNVSVKGTGGAAAPIILPDIHLTNLGQGPDGITPGELTKKIISEVTAEVAKASVKAVADLSKGAVKAVENVGKGATDAAGKAVKGVTDLFKKK